MKQYDLAVIGSGPAGQRAAIQAAKLGKKVLVIDKNQVIGGVSLHSGTIPSKTLREAVLYLSGWRQRGFYGRSYRVKERITAEDLTQRLNMTIRHQVEVLQHQLYRNRVDALPGTAKFVDSNTLSVTTEAEGELRVSADRFLIATGTTPAHPDHIDTAQALYLLPSQHRR